MAFGGGASTVTLGDGVVVVVSPIGPNAGIVVVAVVVVVVTEASVVAGVVEVGNPVAVEVVIVNTVVLVTTVEPVPGTVVGVVGTVVVEVVVTLGRTLNKAVAQVCDPCRHAIIW
ncbi:MAG: hypothetical protein ACRDWF_15390 [Acidimicrobiia bacterium]